MKKSQFVSITVLFFFFCNEIFGQTPTWSWAKSAGGTGNDAPARIAVDINGNSYITGRFDSPTITFGSTALTNASLSNLENDMFIVKYDGTGNVVWAKSAGGTFGDAGRSIAVDLNGNSYVTGYFNSPTITFDSITLTNNSIVPSNDIFVVKYDTSGNVLWAKGFGDISADHGESIAVDTWGDFYLAGAFDSPSITFGDTTLINNGDFDIFVVKFDASGNVVWANTAGSTEMDWSSCISVDNSGNTYLAGYFYSPSITFGSTTLLNSDTTGNSHDVFIVKFDASGNVVWANSGSGSQDDVSYGIAADIFGNTYVTGNFKSPIITFGNNSLTNSDTSGFSSDIFIIKYDPLGNVDWAKSEGGAFSDGGYSIATDFIGNPYMTGAFYSPVITMGSTTLFNSDSGGVFRDLFVVKYDVLGNVVWAISAGGNDNDGGIISVDVNGNPIVTGLFSGQNATFSNTMLSTTGGADFFIAKLNSITTSISQENNSLSTIDIYPNPANNKITIEYSLVGKNVMINIYSLQGQLLIMQPAKQQKTTLDISSLSKGIYIIKISGENEIETKKFMKE